MSLRDQIAAGIKDAMRAKDKKRVNTLRLTSAVIKDMEIAARADGTGVAASDDQVIALLAKMVRQRQESSKAFLEGGRVDLAEEELLEIRILEEYLPKALEPAEVDAAISSVIADVGATSLRDMGRVMGLLKERYNGRMDFGAVGPAVKQQLA